MNFYLAALDDREQPGDGPSIGLIVCREPNRIVVQYALRELSESAGRDNLLQIAKEHIPAIVQ